ncbi:MAG: ribosome biogenesis GTPase Der [Bdellovibrionota bacterium]
MSSANVSFRVAILGRPNVGKSTLFNILTRTRNAVVKNQPGVTRDIQAEKADWWGKTFEILDTGGITNRMDDFSPLIMRQVLEALGRVDLIVVVMDGKTGLNPEDKDIIRIAKECGKPFFVVVNKVDREHEAELKKAEFYELGVDLIHTSFEQRVHVDKVVEKILSYIPAEGMKLKEGVRFVIMGKPNVGKSSLANAILGEKRMIVSEVAGTTVDAIEEELQYKDQNLILVDTAGLRRRGKRFSKRDGVEILSAYKTEEAIRRADVILLVVDSTLGPTEQDARMIKMAYDRSKPVILVANKTDLARLQRDKHREWFRERLAFEFHFVEEIPVMFTSAEKHEGINEVLDEILRMAAKLSIKITTSKLNDFFYDAIRSAPAPVFGNTNVKFYYLTQTQQKPPSFIAFANHPEGVSPSYRRFLIKKIQKEWDLSGVPVRMFIMKSGGDSL